MTLPEKTVEIELTGDFRIAHPELEKPIFCKGLAIHFEGSPQRSLFETRFLFHARSLPAIQQLFGVLPRDKQLLLTLKSEVLLRLNADYLAAQTDDDFLVVGEGACFLLENYTLEMP